MGRGFNCSCNKCGYSFSANLGVGFLYPDVVSDTKAAMIAGEYGSQGKEFFDKYPNGSVDCDAVIAKCNKCKEYIPVLRLSLYKPKDHIKFDENRLWDTETYFDFVEEYRHTCEKCGEKLEIIEDIEDKLINGEVSCLKCGGVMSMNDIIFWD